MDREAIAARITEFAEANSVQLHPGQDSLKWAELLISRGNDGCPCVPGREHCPCDQALEDIGELNRCRCGLFCNQAYIEEYNRLLAERRPKRRWKQKPEGSS